MSATSDAKKFLLSFPDELPFPDVKVEAHKVILSWDKDNVTKVSLYIDGCGLYSYLYYDNNDVRYDCKICEEIPTHLYNILEELHD